jgi:hypothetical protein
VSLGGTVQYQYDDAGRLRRVIYSGSSNKTFVLDAAGNRTQVLETLGGAVLQFSVATASTSEASSPLVVNVTRTGSTNGAVSVNYSTSNISATAGSGYNALAGTLNWASGDAAAKPISRRHINDALLESNEAFQIT